MNASERVNGNDGRRRSMTVVVVIAGLAVIGLLATAYVPRNVTTGGTADRPWSVEVTPGVFSPTIRVVTDAGTATVADLGPTPMLAESAVLTVPQDTRDVTVVVGPTPRRAASVRITSVEGGVGEARIHRVAWRRVHVQVVDAPTEVTELVAISRDGRVVEAVEDPPAPRTISESAAGTPASEVRGP